MPGEDHCQHQPVPGGGSQGKCALLESDDEGGRLRRKSGRVNWKRGAHSSDVIKAESRGELKGEERMSRVW